MKINPKDILTYTKNPDNHDSIFLIFGSNFGLINKTYTNILNALDIDKNNPFSTIKINYSQLVNDKRVLFDEIETYSALDTHKNILIDIRDASDFKIISSIFQDLHAFNLSNIRMIMIASYIRANDSFINIINQFNKGVCIPCYEEDEHLLKQKLNNYVMKNKIQLSNKDISKLSSEFSKNTEINDHIFEKLDLLSISNNVTLQKLTETLNDTSDIEVNELINHALSGKYAESINILNKCHKSKVPSISICRTFIKKFKLLEKIYLLQNQGLTLEKIIQKTDLKIFYKDRDSVRKQIKIWNFQKIQTNIYKFLDIEIKCKKMGEIDYFLIENALLFLKTQIQRF